MAQQDIVVRMGMDASAFNRGLQSAKVQAGKLNSALGGLGAAVSAAGFAAAGAKAVEYGSKISDLSASIGVSTNALQEFDYAASKSGASLEDFSGALRKVAVAREAALGGDGEKMDSFKALGVSVDDLKSKRIEDLFRQIGNAVRDAADVQVVMGDAMKVLGKASGPVLAAMRNDLEAAAEEAKRLGLIISEDTIAKLDALGDQADATGKRLLAGFAPFFAFAMEGVNTMVDGFQSVMATAKRLADMFDIVASRRSSFGDAFREMTAGLQRDLETIGARQDARRAAPVRQAAGVVDFERDEARNANKTVELRQKIAQAEADALGVAGQRAKLEKDIAALKAEQIKNGDAEFARFRSQTPARLAALEAERARIARPTGEADRIKTEAGNRAAALRNQAEILEGKARAAVAARGGIGFEEAEMINRAEDLRLEAIKTVADANANADAVTKKRADELKRVEAEIKDLKEAAAKAAPKERKELERKLQLLELQKKAQGLASKQGEIDKAKSEAEGARGERLKFTLGGLAGANLRNVGDPTLRRDIIAARNVQRLESQAEFLKQRGRVGDLAEAAKRLSVADKVRSGITSITVAERFPFASMDSKLESIDNTMDLILHQGKTSGIIVQARMA